MTPSPNAPRPIIVRYNTPPTLATNGRALHPSRSPLFRLCCHREMRPAAPRASRGLPKDPPQLLYIVIEQLCRHLLEDSAASPCSSVTPGCAYVNQSGDCSQSARGCSTSLAAARRLRPMNCSRQPVAARDRFEHVQARLVVLAGERPERHDADRRRRCRCRASRAAGDWPRRRRPRRPVAGDGVPASASAAAKANATAPRLWVYVLCVPASRSRSGATPIAA